MRKTYRIETRAVSTITYEIDCDSEEEARANYVEGTIVRNEWDYDDVLRVKQIDVAEVQP